MAGITGLLLAAGFSRRFGGDKLLAPINHRPLIAHSAGALSPCDRVIAVVRADDQALQVALQNLHIDYVCNPQPARGMGYSIACAVSASADSDGWCLLPADMPFVKPSTAQQIVQALRAGAALAAPVYRQRRGHPVGFEAAFFSALTTLDGDSGARSILQQQCSQLLTIDTDDAGVLADVDVPADL